MFDFSLGSWHDGVIGKADECLPSSNFIMSPFPSETNVTNLFSFSSCSIRSFKMNLLTSDYRCETINGAYPIFSINN